MCVGYRCWLYAWVTLGVDTGVAYGCWVGVFVLIAGARHRWNIGCRCWVGVLGTSVVEGLGFVVGLGYRSCILFLHFVFFSVSQSVCLSLFIYDFFVQL